MPITGQDDLLAALPAAQPLIITKANVPAVAGRLISLWSAAGRPGVGSTTLGRSATGEVPTSETVGAYPFTNPAGGQLSYIGRAAGQNPVSGLLRVYDILWVWGSGGSGWTPTLTTAQATASPVPLTRPDATGAGTELWMETLAVGGAASGTSTISYTNSAGTPGRTATLIAAKISAPPIGTVERYTLQAGDTGVRSVQSMTNSATWTSGTFRLMIVRNITEVPFGVNLPVVHNGFDLGLPRVYDSACIGFALEANTTATGPTPLKLSLVQG